MVGGSGSAHSPCAEGASRSLALNCEREKQDSKRPWYVLGPGKKVRDKALASFLACGFRVQEGKRSPHFCEENITLTKEHNHVEDSWDVFVTLGGDVLNRTGHSHREREQQ